MRPLNKRSGHAVDWSAASEQSTLPLLTCRPFLNVTRGTLDQRRRLQGACQQLELRSEVYVTNGTWHVRLPKADSATIPTVLQMQCFQHRTCICLCRHSAAELHSDEQHLYQLLGWFTNFHALSRDGVAGSASSSSKVSNGGGSFKLFTYN